MIIAPPPDAAVAAPPPPTGDEVASVRTAAQWLMAAAGAVGAVLVAGLQFGAVGKLVKQPALLCGAILAFAVAIALVGVTIRRASRVLVVSRTTISDLLAADLCRRVAQRGNIEIETDGTAADPDLPWLLDQIDRNRDWLLPDHESVGDLYDASEKARREADRTTRAAAAAESAELGRRLTMLSSFARTELTRRAYGRLADTVTGWPGRIFTVAIIGLTVTLSWPVSEPPSVTTAYRLDILLTGSPKALRKAGLPAGCRTGTRLTGVALDGDLTEPVVATEPRTTPGPATGSPATTCPAARFTVTPDVGIPIPYVPVK